MFNVTRKTILREHWEKELKVYKLELADSKEKPDKVLYMKFASGWNKEYAEILLMQYLICCKNRFALMFLQFRRLLPNSKQTDICEFFDDRKAWTRKYMEKVI
jgi:hypothetical protein